jgi:hypothetical protein
VAEGSGEKVSGSDGQNSTLVVAQRAAVSVARIASSTTFVGFVISVTASQTVHTLRCRGNASDVCGYILVPGRSRN